jgi:hypothetical protein
LTTFFAGVFFTTAVFFLADFLVGMRGNQLGLIDKGFNGVRTP